MYSALFFEVFCAILVLLQIRFLYLLIRVRNFILHFLIIFDFLRKFKGLKVILGVFDLMFKFKIIL